jgi:hypothetical protein
MHQPADVVTRAGPTTQYVRAFHARLGEPNQAGAERERQRLIGGRVTAVVGGLVLSEVGGRDPWNQSGIVLWPLRALRDLLGIHGVPGQALRGAGPPARARLSSDARPRTPATESSPSGGTL